MSDSRSVSFPTTSWTKLAQAGAGDRAALNDLLALYWRPVYAFLRRRGHQPHDAADLTQAFLSDVLLGRDLIGRAERHRGRFRAFLLQALKRFDIDAHRRKQSRGAAGVRLIPSDADVLATAEASFEDDPTRAFERLWAATLMNLALERLETYLTANGYTDHWVVFQERVIWPAVRGTEPTPVGDLAGRLGIEPADRVSKMLYSARRRFRSALRRVVAATVDSPDDVDGELEHLKGYLRT